MSAGRSADTTPDLFTSSLPATAPDPPTAAITKPAPEQPAGEPKHLLPTDLAGSLRRLDDGAIDALLSAVTAEAERRGRLPKRQSRNEGRPATRRTAVEEVASGLTKGKLNAVRAAFKAGVKPSAIARQFGISQSDVRKALAEGSERRS